MTIITPETYDLSQYQDETNPNVHRIIDIANRMVDGILEHIAGYQQGLAPTWSAYFLTGDISDATKLHGIAYRELCARLNIPAEYTHLVNEDREMEYLLGYTGLDTGMPILTEVYRSAEAIGDAVQVVLSSGNPTLAGQA